MKWLWSANPRPAAAAAGGIPICKRLRERSIRTCTWYAWGDRPVSLVNACTRWKRLSLQAVASSVRLIDSLNRSRVGLRALDSALRSCRLRQLGLAFGMSRERHHGRREQRLLLQRFARRFDRGA